MSLVFSVLCRACFAMTDFYVSPQGSDRNPGTLEQPFASLNAAKNAVRSIRKEGQTVTVWLRGGIYVLNETMVFGLQDGAPQGATVRYMAYQDEIPVITSLKLVTGWQKPSSHPDGLPSEAQGNVWVADVGKGADFKVIYGEGKMLSRARSKGFLPMRSETGGASVKRLTVPDSVELRKWENARDVEVLIRPLYPWAMNVLPVDRIDCARRTVFARIGGTYPLEPPPQAFQNVHELFETCWFENALDFLDAPGEWVLDSAAGRLYLWPVDGKPPADIAFPQCVELIRVEGEPQKSMAADRTVRGIEFKGITFTGNDRYTWRDEEPSFQHDWSAVDQASAMLRFRCAEDCVVENCRFVEGGTTGVRLDLQAQNNRIEGNRFSQLGDHGIALCGYGPGTKDVNRCNQILNNRIDHIGKFYWAASGIYVAQSGENRIANNLIYNVPYIGITLSGARDFNWQRGRHGEGYRSIRWDDFSDQNKKMLQEAYSRHEEKTAFFLSYLHSRDNLIEGNEVFSAVEVLGDGNAIYLSGAGTGNRIRRNYIHHILSDGISTAMRPDDLQEQTVFEQNIVYKCVYGAVEHKHKNDYINNIFACIYPTNIRGLEFRDWGYFIFGRGPNTGSRVQNNIFYAGDLEARFMYARKRSPMDDSVIDNNLYWCAADPQSAKTQLQTLRQAGHDLHSLAEDPRFPAIQDGDFSLPENSPAFTAGFRPIDMASIGLQSPWKEKLVGTNLMHTRILPSTHYINLGDSIRVTIECSQPGAVIRYTVDGTEPTEHSAVYESPVRFKESVFLRAKAFKPGAVDLYGAAEFYIIKGTH